MHDLIETNHPGPVDQSNPRSRDWLDRGEAALPPQARTATTQDDYRTVLRDYANGFADGHLGISFSEPVHLVWPGILTRTDRQGGPTRVEIVDGAVGVASGDVLLACDGIPVDTLVAERVLRPRTNPAVPQRLILSSPWLMVRETDDAAAQVNRCRFRNGKGEEHDVPVHWRPIAKSVLEARLQDASGIQVPPLGLHRVGDVWLISIPSFTWTGADAELMERFIVTLRAKAAELHAARHVVIDLRGNGVGNSAWGDDVDLPP